MIIDERTCVINLPIGYPVVHKGLEPVLDADRAHDLPPITEFKIGGSQKKLRDDSTSNSDSIRISTSESSPNSICALERKLVNSVDGSSAIGQTPVTFFVELLVLSHIA